MLLVKSNLLLLTTMLVRGAEKGVGVVVGGVGVGRLGWGGVGFGGGGLKFLESALFSG